MAINTKDRLQLEYEILDRIERTRSLEPADDNSEELERIIIERELAELERFSVASEVLVARRHRRAA
jgi:hypothetical protein